MKRILLTAAIFAGLFGSNVNAQTSGLGIKAGVNFNNITGKGAIGEKLENSILPGITVGLFYDIVKNEQFTIQPGINFTQKFARDVDDNKKYGTNYVEVPVNFLYTSQIGSGNLFVGGGPYVGIALPGKNKFKDGTTHDVKIINNNAPENSDILYAKPIDAGLNIALGYQLNNGFQVGLNTALGLTNVTPYTNANAKNTSFGITVGYKF